MMIAEENAEMMIADAAVKGIVVDAVITQEAAVGTTTQTTMDVTAGQIFVRNPVLNKDPLCSTRIWDADAKKQKTTVVTVNTENTIINRRE